MLFTNRGLLSHVSVRNPHFFPSILYFISSRLVGFLAILPTVGLNTCPKPNPVISHPVLHPFRRTAELAA